MRLLHELGADVDASTTDARTLTPQATGLCASADPPWPLVEFPQGGMVRVVAFSPTNDFIAVGYHDRKHKLSIIHLNRRLWVPVADVSDLDITHDGPILAVAFNAYANRIATACEDKKLRIISIESFAVHNMTNTVRELPHDGSVYAVAYHPNRDIIATGCDDGKVYILSGIESSPPIWMSVFDLGEKICAVAFDPQGVVLATASAWKLTLIHEATRSVVREVRQDGMVTAVAFRPEARSGMVGLIATCCGPTLRLVCPSTGVVDPQHEIQHGGAVTAVAFCPQGDFIATSSVDKKLRIVHVATGALKLQVDHSDSVRLGNFANASVANKGGLGVGSFL